MSAENLEKIARNLGITIKHEPYRNIKGYYLKILKNRFIFVNSKLDERSQKDILAQCLKQAIMPSKRNFIISLMK